MKVELYQQSREPACGDADNCCGYYTVTDDVETVELTDEQFAELERESRGGDATVLPEDVSFPFRLEYISTYREL